jgi:hypothetical protein
VHDEVETIDHMWVTPADALARHDAGEIELVFPTVWNLRLLTRYATMAELVASMSNLQAVPTIQPELVVDDQGHRQVIVTLDPEEVADARKRP